MISFLLASVLSAQANPVTVEIEIAPAAVVLEKLGKEMGVEMIPGGSVTKDVFGIAFTKAPTAKVLSEIATTLNAQWERSSGGTYILNRTPKQEGDEDRAMQEQLRKAIEEGLAKTKNQGEFNQKTAMQLVSEAQKLVSLGTQGAQSERLNLIEKQRPLERLIQTVLETIGPAELIRPWTELPVEYTETGSSRQKRFPASLQAAFRKFEAESKIHADALDALGVANGSHSGHHRVIFQATSGRATGKITYSLQTRILDETAFLAQLRVDAYGSGTATVARVFGPGAAPKQAIYGHFAAGLKETIEMTEDEKMLLDRTTFPNPGARLMIENLATKDFLAYFSETPFRMLARAKKIDRVNLLSDSSWYADYGVAKETGLSLEQYFASPSLPRRYQVDIENGTLRVRPMNRRLVRDGRYPRAQMIQALADLDRLKFPDIEALASLAGATESDYAFNSTLQLVEKASGVSYGYTTAHVNAINMLRLYGRLGPTERAKAHDHGVIQNLPLLPDSSEAVLQKMIYQSGKFVAEFPEFDGIPLGYSMMTQADADLEQNIAVALAAGYPRGSQVRIRLNTVPRLFGRGGDRSQGNSITMVSPSTVGMSMAAVSATQPPRKFEYAVAPNAELVIDVDFVARGKMRFVLFLRQSSTEPKFGPIESLPAEIRAQIEAAYKKAMERQKPPPQVLRHRYKENLFRRIGDVKV